MSVMQTTAWYGGNAPTTCLQYCVFSINVSQEGDSENKVNFLKSHTYLMLIKKSEQSFRNHGARQKDQSQAFSQHPM